MAMFASIIAPTTECINEAPVPPAVSFIKLDVWIADEYAGLGDHLVRKLLDRSARYSAPRNVVN